MAVKLAIWKYPLQVTDVQEIELQIGAQILTVMNQREQPCLWVEIVIGEDDAKSEKRTFRIFGTGEPFPDFEGIRTYVGSFQMRDGLLVFHVYEDDKRF
jgi:hypothetical protein